MPSTKRRQRPRKIPARDYIARLENQIVRLKRQNARLRNQLDAVIL